MLLDRRRLAVAPDNLRQKAQELGVELSSFCRLGVLEGQLGMEARDFFLSLAMLFPRLRYFVESRCVFRFESLKGWQWWRDTSEA